MFLQKSVNITEPTIARCEPARVFRERINRDLNIQGNLSCPQNVDMRAIIPVYDFKLPNKKTFIESQPFLAVDIGGLPGAYYLMIDQAIPPYFGLDYSIATLRAFNFRLQLDIAGRAAMALAGDWITFFMRSYTPAGFNYQWGQTAWYITANPAIGVDLQVTMQSNFTGTPTSFTPAPDFALMDNTIPIAIPKVLPWDLAFFCGLGIGVNFPANTLITMNAIVVCE